MAVYKLSGTSVKNGRTEYSSFLAGNPAYTVPNSYESIATTTVGSGGTASITFSSIPQTYTHLQIRLIARSTNASTDAYIGVEYNGVSSSSYSEHGLYANGSTVAAYSGVGNPFALAQRITAANAASSTFGVIVVDILDYTNTNKYKVQRTLGGYDLNGSGVLGYYSSGMFANTNAITSLRLFPNAGNFAEYSQIALYGIKGA